MKSIAKTTDNSVDNSLANTRVSIDNNNQGIIDIDHDDWEGLTMKQAAKLVEKSSPMIKVLIYSGKVKYKKIKGKYGQEVRINENSLLRYYDLLEGLDNSVDISTDNSIDNTKDNSKANLDNISNTLIFDKFIAGMEKQIEFLTNEIKNKNSEIERLHKLLENQQSLNLQTVHFLNDGDKNNKPTLLERIFGLKK